MNEKRFLWVETSQYALLNPDRSSQSEPLNAHFEIMIRKAVGSNGTKAEGGEEAVGKTEASAGKMSKRTRPADLAKPAPVVILSKLAEGGYPLFGNSREAADFADSLIVADPEWSKSYDKGSGALKFIYQGGAGTLESDFALRIYSDSFNSSAECRGKAVIQVESSNFSQQFEDAFDDSYTISIAQMYVPKILAFAPKSLSPVEEGKAQYLAALGEEVLLTWEMVGDFLKSPTLAENGSPPERVSPDTPVKRRIVAPASFQLAVESNALAGLQDQKKISVGISTAPSVAEFTAEADYCLLGDEVPLHYTVSHAISAFIRAENSAEEEKEVPVSQNSVIVKPAPGEGSGLVTYTLTARGFLNSRPEIDQKEVALYVSRWKQGEGKTLDVPQHTETDGTVRIFYYQENYYCFSGQASWRSGDGLAWEKLSDLAISDGACACRTAVGIYGGELYVVDRVIDKTLYLAKYDLVKKQWSAHAVFGPNKDDAGGAFAFVSDDQMYYFASQDRRIRCYNYSPDPFDYWGVVAHLEVPAKVLDVDSLLYQTNLYIAAVCNDGMVYVFFVSVDLKESGSPMHIKASSDWIRLAEINGNAYVITEAGVFDIRTGEKEDMMFEPRPLLLGVAKGRIVGIGKDERSWSFRF